LPVTSKLLSGIISLPGFQRARRAKIVPPPLGRRSVYAEYLKSITFTAMLGGFGLPAETLVPPPAKSSPFCHPSQFQAHRWYK